MKILLLTTHLNTGGIGVYTVSLARQLKALGVDVSVASSGGDLENKLGEEGIPHIFLGIKTKAEFGIGMWKAVPALNRIVKAEGFDLIHAQTRVSQVLASVSGRKTGVPFVSTCHGFFNYRRLSRRIFPCWGERTIAISNSVKGHLVNDLGVSPEQVDVVYNGIDVDRYKDVGSEKDSGILDELGFSPADVVIGSVGRLSPVKGFNYLIAAFRKVHYEVPSARLVIVGDGPEKNALTVQAREMGTEKEVAFVTQTVSLERYMSVMDVFCLPSVNEGLGLSLMEAMAAGRACVASNVGGLSELIEQEKDGLLVPSKNPENLSRALLCLLGDKMLRDRLGKKARAKAVERFSIKDSVEKTIEVYGAVIREP